MEAHGSSCDRRRRPGEALRRCRSGEGRLVRGPRGPGPRPARAQRRGQDHRGADAHHAAAARRRHRPRARRRRAQRTRSGCGRSIGLAGQYAAVDENLTGRENLPWSASSPTSPSAEIDARADELLEQFALTHAADRVVAHLLRRHAPPARPRRRARAPPAGAVPRRAHHRSRPAGPQRALGRDRGARERRHHRAAHHAVPRGGRHAGRQHRGHRPRQR